MKQKGIAMSFYRQIRKLCFNKEEMEEYKINGNEWDIVFDKIQKKWPVYEKKVIDTRGCV